MIGRKPKAYRSNEVGMALHAGVGAALVAIAVGADVDPLGAADEGGGEQEQEPHGAVGAGGTGAKAAAQGSCSLGSALYYLTLVSGQTVDMTLIP
jgi:hypothetical protein